MASEIGQHPCQTLPGPIPNFGRAGSDRSGGGKFWLRPVFGFVRRIVGRGRFGPTGRARRRWRAARHWPMKVGRSAAQLFCSAGRRGKSGKIGRAPGPQCATKVAMSSRFSKLATRTKANSASVRPCGLVRSRLSVCSRICTTASTVSKPQALPTAATSSCWPRWCRAARRPDNPPAAPWHRGNSPVVARAIGRPRRRRSSPHRVRPRRAAGLRSARCPGQGRQPLVAGGAQQRMDVGHGDRSWPNANSCSSSDWLSRIEPAARRASRASASGSAASLGRDDCASRSWIDRCGCRRNRTVGSATGW